MKLRKYLHPVLFIVLIAILISSSATVASGPFSEIEEIPRSCSSPKKSPSNIFTSSSDIKINEIMFHPSSGGFEWVELKNTGTTSIDITGYGITDEDGNWYTIPDVLPSVPAGDFVVVIFDGVGSAGDDYNFDDNVATLHSPSGMTDIFENDSDQCALYSQSVNLLKNIFLPITLKNATIWNPPLPSSGFPVSLIRSFIAWGAEPGSDADAASKTGIWSSDWFKGLDRGLGVSSGQLTPDESLGLIPGSQTGYLDDWTLYMSSETTKGSENLWPMISWYYPASGATLDSATFAVSWNAVEGATGYQFQMDDDSGFSLPYVDQVLTEPTYTTTISVPEGTYYWHVKVKFPGEESSWSTSAQVISMDLPSPSSPETTAYKTLNIPWQMQHKDTNMLCLDGCTETGNTAWDSPQDARDPHGSNYCVRASISMLASYYGGALSQDRISFEIFGRRDPEGDLGHDTGVEEQQLLDALSWALGENIPEIDGKPTFNQIKGWIDADRPLQAIIPGHDRVIDGYFEFTISSTTYQFIHILDPWDRAKWVSYADDEILYVQVGPAGAGGAPFVRSDEDDDWDSILDTVDDSDGDGICDFDENYRFKTYYYESDTDYDLVEDQNDVREYVFNSAGVYSKRNADVDGDGFRKELDEDNDSNENREMIDGCEDNNQNGKFESTLGETDNFDPGDDMNLHIVLTWPLLGSDVDLHLIKPLGTMNSSSDCYFGNINPDWGIPGQSCDDPILDIDCIKDCTIENIMLSRLENGNYSVKVHYYQDYGQGSTSASVIVNIQGSAYNFGPTMLTEKQVWNVCTISWPSKVVTLLGSVLNLPESE